MSLYSHILIIGCGLIGGSIARAARQYGLADKIAMADANADVVARVKALNIADSVSTDARDLAAQADLILLCIPVGAMGETAAHIMPALKKGAVLSDVGSVKGAVIDAIRPHLRADVHFIPGHPIAGTENSGPEAGFASLFNERYCILTPPDFNDPDSNSPDNNEPTKLSEAALILQNFWQAMGSIVAVMSAQRHDKVLATTSHVPHLLAFTLVSTAVDMERVTNNDVVKYSAGGFRDFTRIAASDPIMWRDIFLSNKTAVLEIVDRYIEDLSAIKRAIRWDDGEQLIEKFSKTRNIRRDIIEAGQDMSAVNFGRDETSNDQ